MLAFTLRRAIQAIGVMIAVGVIAFSMFRFAGDPVNQIVSLDTPAAEVSCETIWLTGSPANRNIENEIIPTAIMTPMAWIARRRVKASM